MAENAWNGRDPAKVAQAYMAGTKWRNRAEFLNSRAEVEAFLTRVEHPKGDRVKVKMSGEFLGDNTW